MNKYKYGVIFAFALCLSGCIVSTEQPTPTDAPKKMITRDGLSLPSCEDLPDASQSDNGNRCWYD